VAIPSYVRFTQTAESCFASLRQKRTAGFPATAGDPNGATASLRVIAAHLVSMDNEQ
jgi:hypothetical protein